MGVIVHNTWLTPESFPYFPILAMFIETDNFHKKARHVENISWLLSLSPFQWYPYLKYLIERSTFPENRCIVTKIMNKHVATTCCKTCWPHFLTPESFPFPKIPILTMFIRTEYYHQNVAKKCCSNLLQDMLNTFSDSWVLPLSNDTHIDYVILIEDE